MVVLALAALLGGCSAIKLGYGAAPQAAYWWLDGYLDFNEAQSARVREDLARLHQWHRTKELPQYVALLQRVERMVPSDIRAEEACAWVSMAQLRLGQLIDQAEPATLALVTSLAPRQLQHMERKYAKDNAQYRSDWLDISPAQRMDKRLKQLVERSETIYGALEAPQKAAIQRELDRSAFDPSATLSERKRRQQDLLTTLRRINTPGVSAAQARELLRGYLDRVWVSPDASYAVYQKVLLQESCAAFAAAHNSTTPSQRDNAVRRLRAYQRDLLELAAD